VTMLHPHAMVGVFSMVAALVLISTAMGRGQAAALDAHLDEVAKRYEDDVHMPGKKLHSPGYHTTVKDGTWVHGTREGLHYAVALLKRGKGDDNARAAKIIPAVLALQDTDSANKTYGIWPWLLEEPLARMSPPDWNWADFCGASIAQMLICHRKQLSPVLADKMRQSLRHAVNAIRKRNVGPGYTNIAIMGGGVTAAAGEILDDPALLDYGRKRLQRCVEHARYHGGFNEYSSPTYTRVALQECERVLMLVRDDESRKAAEALRRVAWQTIAQSFHPGTGQWAGPHSRAYGDFIRSSLVAYLRQQTGAAVKAPGGSVQLRGEALRVDAIACPDDLAGRFSALPADPHQIRRRFIRRKTPDESVFGTTWFTADACLGTVNHSEFWTQRRPVLGYWRRDHEVPVVFRMRFLLDDKDFASMGVRTAQTGPRALAVLVPLRRRGAWHLSLDRPKDGIFHAKDLRVRFEVRGKGVQATRLDGGRMALQAGDWRIVIHPAGGKFDGRDVSWELGGKRGHRYVDGICYHGAKKALDFKQPPHAKVAVGIELLHKGTPPSRPTPTWSIENRQLVAKWAVDGDLVVSMPGTQ
jgi:hypothetical protein